MCRCIYDYGHPTQHALAFNVQLFFIYLVIYINGPRSYILTVDQLSKCLITFFTIWDSEFTFPFKEM